MRCGLDHTAPVELCRIFGAEGYRLVSLDAPALPFHTFPEAWFPAQGRPAFRRLMFFSKLA